jgi:hypothetical protein
MPATHALTPNDGALPEWKAPAWIRYLDLVLAAVALPVFLLAGFPLLGWVAGAGIWLVQRGLQTFLERRAEASSDPRTVVGLLTGSMIGRGWLVALTIFGVGLADEQAGLAAAVLVVLLFTAYFTVQMIVRSLSRIPSA